MIYFMQPTDDGPIKIGFTDDLPTRHKALEAYYRRPLAILAMMDGGQAEEAEIHRRFAHLRFGRTEQFRPAPELMTFIGRALLVGANPDTVEAMDAPGRYGTLIRVSDDFADALRKVCALENLSVAEFAEANLLPIVQKRYRDSLAREAKRMGGQEG